MFKIACGGALLFVAVYILGFWWEYTHILPQVSEVPNHTRWYHGLLHGVYAPLNFVLEFVIGDNEDTIFQTGGGRIYQFWFIIGIGGFTSGASGGSRIH